MNLNSSFQIQIQDRKQENRVLEHMFDIKFQNVTFKIESLFNESTDHLETLQDLVDEVTMLQKDVGLVNVSARAEEVARNMSEQALEKLSKDVSNVTKQVQAVVSSVMNLESVKTSLDARLMHIEQEQNVYFDVSFPDYRVASFSNNDVLKFNDIRYNVGGGYNATSGNFTAPVKGVYLFLINGVNDYLGQFMTNFNLFLMLEEAKVAGTTTSGTLSGSGTAFAILELSAGSSVYVTIDNMSGSDTLIGQYFTSFMGVRLPTLS
ncbi:uncharacterized protein LOC124151527 [Haliotis rufescens]|uniref:uncharacterized protein LOC124151527 n=1 Tax=Haliotis rufescens TaxID=6454 RepID=UPI00201F8593|nr:uncharacterized protein LOC124151527 [Haliotis rufescens]